PRGLRRVRGRPPHPPPAVDVEELGVDDVAVEHDLALATLEVAQVEPHRLQRHPVLLDLGHVVARYEHAPAADLHHDPRHRGIGLTLPAHDEIEDAPDLAGTAIDD